MAIWGRVERRGIRGKGVKRDEWMGQDGRDERRRWERDEWMEEG